MIEAGKKHKFLFFILFLIAYNAILGFFGERYGKFSLPVLLGAIVFAAWSLFCVFQMNMQHPSSQTTGNRIFLPLALLAVGNLFGEPVENDLSKEFVVEMLILAVSGITEEFLFRGLLFRGLQKEESLPAAVFLSALIFGLNHVVTIFFGKAFGELALQTVFAVEWGIAFAVAYAKTENLLACMGIHGLLNALSCVTVLSHRESVCWVILMAAADIVACFSLSGI